MIFGYDTYSIVIGLGLLTRRGAERGYGQCEGSVPHDVKKKLSEGTRSRDVRVRNSEEGTDWSQKSSGFDGDQ